MSSLCKAQKGVTTSRHEKCIETPKRFSYLGRPSHFCYLIPQGHIRQLKNTTQRHSFCVHACTPPWRMFGPPGWLPGTRSPPVASHSISCSQHLPAVAPDPSAFHLHSICCTTFGSKPSKPCPKWGCRSNGGKLVSQSNVNRQLDGTHQLQHF